MSLELSHGSVCSQTLGWTLGKLVEGRVSLGGRTAGKEGEEDETKTTTNRVVVSVCGCEMDGLATVAACGSSPHAQCMA